MNRILKRFETTFLQGTLLNENAIHLEIQSMKENLNA